MEASIPCTLVWESTFKALNWAGQKPRLKWKWTFAVQEPLFSTVRLRHAYLNLDWGKPSLLLGQTWHPLYGDVAPQILNLNMGAPFQPFSRAPQIRFRYKTGDIQLTGAAIWQSQYLSQGLMARARNTSKKAVSRKSISVQITKVTTGW